MSVNNLSKLLRLNQYISEGYSCDACDSYIDIHYPGRVTCLDCEMKRGATSSQDFCVKMECINKTLTDVKRLESPHLPSHRVLLIRRDQLLRYKLKEVNAAKQAVTKGGRIFNALVKGEYSALGDYGSLDAASESPDAESDAEDDSSDNDQSGNEDVDSSEEESQKPGSNEETVAKSEVASENLDKREEGPGQKCGVCDEDLQTPCWYCMDCTRECSSTFLPIDSDLLVKIRGRHLLLRKLHRERWNNTREIRT